MQSNAPTASGQGIEKTPTGIEGFDEITRGGLPRRRTTLVLGAPGCGKTIFALQTLVNGARQRAEPGIFVAFEENSREIIQNAATFGWDLPGLEKEKLFFLDARMSPDVIQAGSFDLLGMLASLKAKADEIGAKRIIFDSVDVLLALLDDRVAERRELYRIHDWLVDSELTGVLTMRTDTVHNTISRRYEFLQFMADCVIFVQRTVQQRLSRRYVRIVKYRGSSFDENEYSMVIDSTGIEVYGSGQSQAEYPVFTDRVSTGIAQLDTMLGGGYYRGSSILLTGIPGTAKSTLSAAFAQAAFQRGEKTLYVSFDESNREFIRNMASVGIDLAESLHSDMLQIYWARQYMRSAEVYLMTLRKLINEFKPRCLVIDSLSTMLQASSPLDAIDVAQKLIHLTKRAGITVVFTSQSPPTDLNLEVAPSQTSTLVDTWIHLSYRLHQGERNRALTIIKSRGIAHFHQVREMVLSDNGITLTDVYVADNEVLMGSRRQAQQAIDQRMYAQEQAEIEDQQAALALSEVDTQSRIEVFERELEVKRRAIRALQRKQSQSGSGAATAPSSDSSLPETPDDIDPAFAQE